MKEKRMKILTLLFAIVSLTNCKQSTSNSGDNDVVIDESDTSEEISSEISWSTEDFYQNYDLSLIEKIQFSESDYTTTASNGVIQENSTISITKDGIYELSGTYLGDIVVNTSGVVRLIFNNVNITSQRGAALVILSAKKCIISATPNSTNSLTDTSEYNYSNSDYDKVDSVIYSKDDLVINGYGTLSIHAQSTDGIKSNDSLKMCEVNLFIDAVDDGIKCNDAILIQSGSFTLTTGGDGIHCENEDDSTLGYILVEDGTFAIHSQNDALQSSSIIRVEDGDFDLFTYQGSSYSVVNDESAKGLKASIGLEINGGSFIINSSDDTLHSNDYIKIKKGTFVLNSNDDGIHADNKIVILDGSISINKCYEGIEAMEIQIGGGIIEIESLDDGINVAGGNDSSSIGGRPGQNTFGSNSNNKLVVTGGSIYISSNGDGLDANGSIYISNGLILVCGPTANNNSAIDYDAVMNVTGGTIIAVGSSGMAQAPSLSSSQYSFKYNLSLTISASTLISIFDDSNQLICAFIPAKNYQSIVVSSPLLQSKKSYTIYKGGTISSEPSTFHNYFSIGTVTNSTKISTVTLSSMTTSIGSSTPGN